MHNIILTESEVVNIVDTSLPAYSSIPIAYIIIWSF